MSTAVLSQGVGYAVVLGIGLGFAVFMVGLTRLQNRYSSYKVTSVSEFTSASHSVKPGLIASGIVSAWTWAATLLQSSAVAYEYGISGPWFYAAGATVQVLLFATISSKLKMNAPGARTFLEVLNARWGKPAHFTFGFFAAVTNILVSSMLITGGSDTVASLTGMSIPAACMLIPVGVVVYVLVGGMRASLMADYIHTSVLFAIIMAFMFSVYVTSDQIGSPGKMYDMLVAAADKYPVSGNAEGSYVTMSSRSGLMFGFINLVGNCYWQRAIASEPRSCVKAFLLGGSAWIAVPLAFATTMGLTARVLSDSPSFPGYPNPLTAAQVTAGLPASAAAAALLGPPGAVAVLVLLFLAVTSAASAELVAVSSLITFDVYVPYINPRATEKQILWVDHAAIVGYGVCMGILGLIFYYSGVGMGYLYEMMGVLIGSAVLPVALAILTRRANKYGCIAGAWLGLLAGIGTWLGTTAALNDGVLSLDTTFQDVCMLAGNVAAIGVGAIVSVGSSLFWPEDFDFDITRALNAHDVGVAELDPGQILDVGEAGEKVLGQRDVKRIKVDSDEEISSGGDVGVPSPAESYDEKKNIVPSVDIAVVTRPDEEAASLMADLQKSFKLAAWVSIGLFCLLIIIIPLPLYFTAYIYPKGGFTAWIIVTFVMVFYGAFTVVVYPIYESRAALKRMGGAIIRDAFGGGLREEAERVEA